MLWSDRDTVRIGNQVWTIHNLDLSVFRNGDAIPEVKSNEEWTQAAKDKKPAWCYYDNDKTNESKYGKLYNWYAVIDPRGLAPLGWHIPSEEEWLKVRGYASNNSKTLSSLTSDWKGTCDKSIDSCGFKGLPGGLRMMTQFSEKGYFGNWWTTTSRGPRGVSTIYLTNSKFSYGKFCDYSFGLSVRCVKD